MCRHEPRIGAFTRHGEPSAAFTHRSDRFDHRFGAQQDVRQNRQGGAGADDVLHGLQAGDDLGFGNREVHA